MLGVGGQGGQAEGRQQQVGEGEVALDGVIPPPDVPDVGVASDEDQAEAGGAEVPVHRGHGVSRGQQRGQEGQGEEAGGQQIVQVTSSPRTEILDLDDIQRCLCLLRVWR